MTTFPPGRTIVRRDVHRSEKVWSEHALRVISDNGDVLVTACAPGAQTRWPALYTQARADNDRSVRTEAFDAMAAGRWDLTLEVWQETELLIWKPSTTWFSINAFFTADGLRNWYINFEHPTRRTHAGFDTFDLTVDLVISPDLSTRTWKDEDEYAHVRRLGIVTDAEHQEVEHARELALAMIDARTSPFDTDRWTTWRWNPDWPHPTLA
ncbi:MAG: DUF402 domain-containing protein [Streptomyces sp.]|jgi:protein associated with RNAse G/E|nr:DUF402 domain-containing protein [Streptomyces sp.]